MREDIIQERIKKVQQLRQLGVDPYPARTTRSHTASELIDKFAQLEESGTRVSVAGRLMSFRSQGSIVFADLKDESGVVQVVLKRDTLPVFDSVVPLLERGDFVAVEGTVFVTKKGEKSIEAQTVQLLTKSIRPIPTEWFGLEHEETRLRTRYLDVLFHEETKELFRKKALFWHAVREYMLEHGFLEVETSTLEDVPGGAEAEPFVTHHNALDQDFYLRISLELPLKKLLVGGYEKVFEIGRIFRNEGIDREHLQDYTQLEFYWAYSDYRELMKFLHEMYQKVIHATTGGLQTKTDAGLEIDWSREWQQVDYVEAFKQETDGLDPLEATDAQLREYAVNTLNLSVEHHAGRGRLIDVIYKKTVRPKLIQPCFLIDPPAVIEPLAKRKFEDPRRVERVQIVAAGTELGKGFSELNDPVDQRERFQEQAALRAAGDTEAQMMDESFVEALEYGMPPAAGFGVSERLFSVLMGKSVRETVLYPLLKRKGE